MHTWIEFSNAVLGGAFLFGFAVLLLLGLREVVLGMRSWWVARKARSPEDEAVDDVDHYQGAFHLQEHGVVRQRFARRFELRFHNHWACAGKWRPDD